MIDSLIAPLAFMAALGTGLIAGTFFAFSSFVMKALARLAPAQGIAAMQMINIVVLTPLFLGVFMGTAFLSLALIGIAGWFWMRDSLWLLSGGLLYLLGCFLVTIAGNVPLNNALAPLPAASPETAIFWRRYLDRWVALNHLRTLGALASCAAFITALLIR
jgi:uncharacterized membrane protein